MSGPGLRIERTTQNQAERGWREARVLGARIEIEMKPQTGGEMSDQRELN